MKKERNEYILILPKTEKYPTFFLSNDRFSLTDKFELAARAATYTTAVTLLADYEEMWDKNNNQTEHINKLIGKNLEIIPLKTTYEW